MKQAFEDLLSDRQFNLVLKGLAPWLPKSIRNGLMRMAFWGVKTPLDFQVRFMWPVVKYIIRKYTDGCTFDDSTLRDKRTPHSRYTFLSNHRDIVLDSALLDVKLVEAGYGTTVEIGIGDNLLIYPWIKRLVRMNKAFTVKRGLSPKAMLQSSQLMSSYIHYAVTQKHENIWIAQREGRAKDSDDRTQESVLKMLTMGGLHEKSSVHETCEKNNAREKCEKDSGSAIIASIRELNIVPLTISYEYDPCDFLKAQEFQQKRDVPGFKKSRQDDLDNMKTGIFGYKGRVHYHCGRPVNEWIDELAGLPRNDFYAALSQRIDKEIHSGYRIFPNNYIALDELSGTHDYADHYTEADKERFEQYVKKQIDKVNLPDKDVAFLRERILTMYENPLKNYLKAK